MKETSKRAEDLFESGFYCAESVLQALAEKQDIKSDIIPGIATGFCAGVARTCGMCGAVSGGIMGIGLLMGRIDPDEPIDQIYMVTQKFLDMFKEKYASINCKEITGFDFGKEEDRERFKEINGKLKCIELAGVTAGMVASLIDEI